MARTCFPTVLDRRQKRPGPHVQARQPVYPAVYSGGNKPCSRPLATHGLDTDECLHTIGKPRYGLPTEEDRGTEPRIEAGKVRLRDVLKSRKNVIDYLYDFGDSWGHRITVTNIRPGESGVSYPRYIAGEWNAPPEDCGGIPGFYAMLEAVADPNHPNHAEAKEWLDEYDPKVIDDLPIKYALSRIANRRNAAKARLANNKQTPSATE